ncbi:MAG: 3-isopropylmalate dehydrogenase [Lachnospiraceae bacterium]|nr:3-isopropylmalate dehydrogenase [Lachnospiraceae bacterium]
MADAEKNVLQWHPAFYAGLQIEFAEEANNLYFENEHQLGTKPKQIDVLIIRKDTKIPIYKNIGRIFRKHNIVEYKAPDDYLSIDDFYKVYGYTCFYKADTAHVNTIKIDDITISLVSYGYPRKLVKHLDKRGYKIKYIEKGIYYIEGLLVPIQLILTSELSREENLWLSSLTNNLKEKEYAEQLVEEYKKHKNDKRYESVMNLITNANKKVFKEVNRMCQAFLDIVKEEMADEIEEMKIKIKQEAMKEGMQQGMKEGMQQGMQQGMEEGIQQGTNRVNQLINSLIKASRMDEIEKVVTDNNYQQKLFEEFGL